ncbi:MAG: glycosyltransferase family 4 protein [Deltaproteobacteria bacterium]|nr:glycosyltransferase family 4 protein [Deltaproteobacteria bacterium]MBW2075083.1 glycosyltransferase family 4 protein [Deltaproteobacteria bacterium]RLB82247.1 MAG: glycosyltransferase family 1 protein [Deltaproteobacteria bacterium]
MKICFFNVTTTVLVGGLETYCISVASELAKLGCEVDILGGHPAGSEPIQIPDVRVVTFPFYPAEKVPIGGTRGSRLIERLTFAYNARHFFLSQDYDVVVIVKPFDFHAMCWFRRKKDFKVVYRSGGREFYITDRLFSRCVDYFISSSHYNAAQVQDHYKVPVEVIHNGVDINKFKPRKRNLNLADRLGLKDSKVIITIGRLVGWKGLQVLMGALPDIKKAIPNVRWIVVGGGPYRDALQLKCRELKLQDSVVFSGEIPHDRLPEFISLADVMVQPSIAEEAFGITLVEAMACGIPAVGSRIGGIPEIIVHGQTGFLVPPRDKEALAEAIIKVLHDDHLRRRYGANSRERVVEHFTWASNARRLLEIFRSLSEGK